MGNNVVNFTVTGFLIKLALLIGSSKIVVKLNNKGEVISNKAPAHASIMVLDLELEFRRILLAYMDDIGKFRINPKQHLLLDLLNNMYVDANKAVTIYFSATPLIRRFLNLLKVLTDNLYIPRDVRKILPREYL